MNLESIKLGFCSYLEKLNETSYKHYYSSDAELSIFLYANEFKEYISDELDIDPEILSMDINEILNMSIVDGKLVEPDEEKEENNFEYDTEGTQNLIEGGIGEPQTEGTTETEGTVPESGVPETPTNNQEQKPPTIAEVIANGENEEKTSISGMINELFEMGLFKNYADADENGELNEEEIKKFLNAIKGYDGNENDISIEDILSAMSAIVNNEFSLDGTKPSETPETTTPETGETTQPNQVDSSTPSGGGNASNVGGSSGGGGSNSVGQTQNQQPQEKTLENMTKEELNSELKTAESDLSEKQSTLSSILDGSDPELESLQENIDEAYELYQEKLKEVDEEMAEQVDDLQNDINSKEDEIDEKEQEIADQETTVSESKTAYENAVSTRENLETSLAALEGIDTSDMDSDKKAELSSKISELRSKIEKAKEDEQKAKDDWEAAEEKLEELNGQKDTLQGELDGLNEQMTELEAAIAEKYPEIKEYMDAHNEAKKEYNEYKQEAISTAKADITEAQNYVNEINTAITNVENKETTKEYCFGDFGEEVLEFAKQFIGYNEADGSADIFFGNTGYTASGTPWCAAFVEYIMENSGNYEDVPDWYRNIDNKWYCPNVYNAANSAGAIINGNEVKQGDIVLFDWDGDGSSDHIGIVDRIENGQIITIEGNTSNQVAERTYDLNDSRLTYCQVTG